MFLDERFCGLIPPPPARLTLRFQDLIPSPLLRNSARTFGLRKLDQSPAAAKTGRHRGARGESLARGSQSKTFCWTGEKSGTAACRNFYKCGVSRFQRKRLFCCVFSEVFPSARRGGAVHELEDASYYRNAFGCKIFMSTEKSCAMHAAWESAVGCYCSRGKHSPALAVQSCVVLYAQLDIQVLRRSDTHLFYFPKKRFRPNFGM